MKPDQTTDTPPVAAPSSSAGRDRLVLFASLLLLVALAVIALFNPNLNDRQWFTFLCILALAAGGFTAFLPGTLDWNVSRGVRATGALAVVMVIITLGLRVESLRAERNWALVPDSGDGPNPDDAVVYVSLDDQVVKASGTASPVFPVRNPKAGKEIAIDRGSGGIVVNVPRALPGQRLLIFVEHDSKWWKSKEIKIPSTDRLELKPTKIEELRRRIP